MTNKVMPFNYLSGRDTFQRVRDHTWNLFLSQAHQVPASMWQGVDVSKRPEMVSYELMNYTFTFDLKGNGDLDHWREDIKPNLPWADDHFEERVCGAPINPGVEWENWPWGKSADTFRKPAFGPGYIPSQDLAYLAGMIDGEGTIYFRDTDRWQGVIRVYQKDPMICYYLHDKFKVGKVTSNNEKTKTNIHGKEVDNHCWYWQVNSQLEIRWLLSILLPHLVIKKDKAQEALDRVTQSIDSAKNHDRLKKVWDRDWQPRFNHNYMSRYWPRGDNDSPYIGMEGNEYGDLNDLVRSLAANPLSRQEWFPIFHPEDVGNVVGGRKPCSLGYQFWVRNSRLHVYYPLRSCDFFRHMQDDIYLTLRLQLWVLNRCREIDSRWWDILPGTFTMHCTSLHVFANDFAMMQKEGPK